jgi:hypothetical protein
MKPKNALGLSFILFLIGLPLISFGSANEMSTWVLVGLAVTLVGAAIPPILHIGSMISGGSDDEE